MADQEHKVVAWAWVHAKRPHHIGYPGISGGELFFSSPEKFKQLLGREMDEFEALVKVPVPPDFDNWDFIPNDY